MSMALAVALCGVPLLAPGSPEKAAYQPQAGVRVGGFWGGHYKRLVCRWLPHCIRQMEAGGEGEEFLNLVHAGEALREEDTDEKPRSRFKGDKASDAYVFNVVEAICLALELDPGDDPELRASLAYLRRKLDAWIPVILAAQEPSGYIDSYMLLEMRPHFTRVEDRELFVMGHFIEMAIAHRRATGDKRLFEAAVKCADFLYGEFGPAPKRTWTNGAPGLEYALCLLSDATGDERYARLAQYMIHRQHTHHACTHRGCQADTPAEQMTEAKGHAVHANAFYTGMAAVASRVGDTKLGAAAARLFSSILDRKYYLTGGVGSDYTHEAYGHDYVLPHDAYASSCAGCAFEAFAREIRPRLGCDKAEAVRERVLYNCLLGAISRDGSRFFYQNPLVSNRPRVTWHGCACCVGNVPRTLLALKDTVFSVDDETLYVNQYMDLENATVTDVEGNTWHVTLKTDYPQSGLVTLTTDAPLDVAVRFPNRAESALYTASPAVPHGYKSATLQHSGGTSKTYVWELPLPEQTVTASPAVESCRDKSALQRGPIVYAWQTSRKRPEDIPAITPVYDRLNDGDWTFVWRMNRDATFRRAPNRRDEAVRPLLSGSHPDPSVCIGHDGAYYISFASCMWTPGLPVIRSENFTDWSIVGHAIDDPLALQSSPGALTDRDGICAPTIRFHDGRYYIVFSFREAASTRLYLTRADLPSGPWSEPKRIAEADGDTTPSLFFDDDGKAYLLASTRAADASRPDRRAIYIQRIDLKTARLWGERTVLTTGISPDSIKTARPQLHKLGEKYVLLVSEGGLSREQAVTVLHADALLGPYTPIRTNPAMTYRDRGPKSLLLSTGRADLVPQRDGEDGTYFAVFSALRPLGEDGRVLLGYETFASPVLWRDGDMIFEGERLIPGTIISRSEPHTVACAPFKAILSRVRLRAFDETRHDAHEGDAFTLYRAADSYLLLACEKDAVSFIVQDAQGRRTVGQTHADTSQGVSLRFVSTDGLTVRAYANATLLGEVSTLSLAEAGSYDQLNGLGFGPVKLPQGGDAP